MEYSYILMSKEQSTNDLVTRYNIREMLKKIFSSVKMDRVYFNEEDFVEYTLSHGDKTTISLKVHSNLSDMKAAHILNDFSNKLLKGEHRRNFVIVKDYCESSHLYCCKLMPLFGRFERLIRKLIYLTLTKAFGSKWFEESFFGDIESIVKEKCRNVKERMIESALEELTYEDLLSYLFTPISKVNAESIVERYSRDSLLSKSKDEIIDLLEDTRKISLWDKLFSDQQDLQDLERTIKELQPLRNAVMHHKNIEEKIYNQARQLLNKINKKLQNAVDNKTYSDDDCLFAVQSLRNITGEGLIGETNSFISVGNIASNRIGLGLTFDGTSLISSVTGILSDNPYNGKLTELSQKIYDGSYASLLPTSFIGTSKEIQDRYFGVRGILNSFENDRLSSLGRKMIGDVDTVSKIGRKIQQESYLYGVKSKFALDGSLTVRLSDIYKDLPAKIVIDEDND